MEKGVQEIPKRVTVFRAGLVSLPSQPDVSSSHGAAGAETSLVARWRREKPAPAQEARRTAAQLPASKRSPWLKMACGPKREDLQTGRLHWI